MMATRTPLTGRADRWLWSIHGTQAVRRRDVAAFHIVDASGNSISPNRSPFRVFASLIRDGREVLLSVEYQDLGQAKQHLRALVTGSVFPGLGDVVTVNKDDGAGYQFDAWNAEPGDIMANLRQLREQAKQQTGYEPQKPMEYVSPGAFAALLKAVFVLADGTLTEAGLERYGPLLGNPVKSYGSPASVAPGDSVMPNKDGYFVHDDGQKKQYVVTAVSGPAMHIGYKPGETVKCPACSSTEFDRGVVGPHVRGMKLICLCGHQFTAHQIETVQAHRLFRCQNCRDEGAVQHLDEQGAVVNETCPDCNGRPFELPLRPIDERHAEGESIEMKLPRELQ